MTVSGEPPLRLDHSQVVVIQSRHRARGPGLIEAGQDSGKGRVQRVSHGPTVGQQAAKECSRNRVADEDTPCWLVGRQVKRLRYQAASFGFCLVVATAAASNRGWESFPTRIDLKSGRTTL